MRVSSDPVSRFRTVELPEPARLAGYAALIETLGLRLPEPRLARAVSRKQRRVKEGGVQIHPSPHWPGDRIADHLIFAIKHEGVNLLALNAIFAEIGPGAVADIVRATPTGVFARRLWFLYEWLRREELPLPDAKSVKYALALDPAQQVCATEAEPSPRHRVRDNLLGVRAFCPTIYRTRKLDGWSTDTLRARTETLIEGASADVLRRAAAFLLLADSKASFAIEGEQPPDQRLRRWAQIIGRAGNVALSVDQLVELQKIVIGDARFVHLGLREEGGFIGQHNALREPVPDHVSARHEDLPALMNGLVAFASRAKRLGVDPIVDAACEAFGFVFIHPFEDGNGRIHRFLMHHVLAERGFTPPGVTFPVSAVILNRLLDYRAALEAVSAPMLPWIDWRPTESGDVEVLNETIDFYRYFDATPQVEFLYEVIDETLRTTLPEELRFLELRDRFHRRTTQIVDMPERTLDLLLSFLRQNDGTLSKRARGKEFAALTEGEAARIEAIYAEETEAVAET